MDTPERYVHRRQTRESKAAQFAKSAASLMEQLRTKSLMDCVSPDDIKRLSLAFHNLELKL